MKKVYVYIIIAKKSLDDLDDFIKEKDIPYCIFTIRNIMLALEIANPEEGFEPCYESLIEKTKAILPFINGELHDTFIKQVDNDQLLLARAKTTPSDNYRIVESLIKKAPFN